MKYLVKSSGGGTDIVEADRVTVDEATHDLIFHGQAGRQVARFHYWSSFRLITVDEEGKKL